MRVTKENETVAEQNEKDEMGGTCSRFGGEYRILVGKPEGRSPHVRSRHRWDNNSKMDFEEIRRDRGLDRSA